MQADDAIKARCIELAQHAVGLGQKRPYTRHGKQFYRPYRNYFTTLLPCEPWELMVYSEYAEMREYIREGRRAAKFWLTRAGLDWLGEQLGMHIYDERH